METRKRQLETGLFIAGLILFLALAHRFGWQSVLEAVRLAGWGLLAIVGQEVGAHVLNTLGWRFAFPDPRRRPPFSSLFAARIAGDATNYVTPTATLGGELLRLQLLWGVADRTEVAASLAVAKLAQTLGQAVFIAAGVLMVAPFFALEAKWWWLVAASLATMGLVLWILLRWQQRGMFASVGKWLWRGRPEAELRWSARLHSLDEQIRQVYKRGRFRLVASVTAFALGWAFGVVEMYLIFWSLGLPASWTLALAVEVLSAAIDGLLFFVPAKMGTQEGGKALIFTLLGMDPAHGFAVGVLRRIRELVWAGVGLGVWWVARWRRGVLPASASAS
jgi:uncharacterized protein (TIRG00374 family)